ncbi:methanethiol S-methyltransferase [Dokdonella sp.]|uniref:methanethiol S-methyltransferase n=1 Tax=Dokdonella sp. TaxID=2291710 RepID=UPI003C6939B6
MKRTAILLYGVLSYFVFFATILYAIGFVGNIWVPKSIDSAPTSSFLVALLTNLGLLALFAVQHSVMARPAFKRAWTRIIPEAAERSTYVLLSSVALIVLFVFWQPMGGVIWQFESAWIQAIFYTLFGLGWATVFLSTFLINHFDLFGLRQVWLEFRGRPYTNLGFVTPGPYRWVRHPLYFGFILSAWFTPTMTVAHLVYATMITSYILIGIQFEENDLRDALPDYERYQAEVPMLIPRPPQRMPNPVVGQA